MPNGHGGIPRFGSSVLLLLYLVVLALIEARSDLPWVAPAAYAAAVLLGWRTAWHLVMYPVLEYGGAYATAEEMAAARRRYRGTAAVGIAVVVAMVALVWRMLG